MMAAAFNITSIKTSSSGVWQGDNPLHYAFPLLILQTSLVVAVSHLLAFLMKPLRQPKVVAEILGGILLGPSALGRNKAFVNTIFPPWSTPILESVASIGLLFFLFLVGLELDLSSIRRSGRRAFPIALVGISLPFILAVVIVTVVIRHTVHTGPYTQTLVFYGVSLSITAFPVLARILAELSLLTTTIGETAMSAAAFNDVAAWVLLALAVALTGAEHGPMTAIWILVSAAGFVGFMLGVVRPAISRIGTTEGENMGEVWISVTLVGVMLSGFITDLIGIHSIFGAFVFGLCIPKRGEFAERLTKRIEDFVSTLLLPLYFASSGLKTNVAKIRGLEAWVLLVLVTSAACAGKILGTFVVAILCMIPARESLTLGFLMNTKGLVELIVLNIGREKKVLDEEMFTILVMMALVTTLMTTPIVLAIYKKRVPPSNGNNSDTQIRYLNKKLESMEPKDEEELRVLCCVRGPEENVPSMANLMQLVRSPLPKVYLVHLMELTDRPSSIMMLQRIRNISSFSFIHRLSKGQLSEDIAITSKANAEINNQVAWRPLSVISRLYTMHEDICQVARQKRATIIILPYHKQWRRNNDEEIMEDLVGHAAGWRSINQRVLQNAPCTVAIFVDRNFQSHQPPKRVCILCIGGPDDHEALELGGRMSENGQTHVTVIPFLKSNVSFNLGEQKEQDEAKLVKFQQRWGTRVNVEYAERTANDLVNQVVAIGQSGEFDLIIVGKGRFPTATKVENLDLGEIGDALASAHGILASVLVIQQYYNQPHLNELQLTMPAT